MKTHKDRRAVKPFFVFFYSGVIHIRASGNLPKISCTDAEKQNWT